jgi:hypothetical protein
LLQYNTIYRTMSYQIATHIYVSRTHKDNRYHHRPTLIVLVDFVAVSFSVRSSVPSSVLR